MGICYINQGLPSWLTGFSLQGSEEGFLFYLCFLGPHLQHMKVPRLRVESELQLPPYATAMRDLSLVYDLHHS